MDLEARMSAAEVRAVLESWFPLVLDLRDDGDREREKSDARLLSLTAPRGFRLVPDEGARFTCTGALSWPLPWLPDPIALPSIEVAATLSLRRDDHGPSVRVTFGVAELDVGGLPALLDRGVGHVVRRVLEARDLGFSVDIARLLTVARPLSSRFRSVAGWSFAVPRARLTVTEHEVRLAGEALLGVRRPEAGREPGRHADDDHDDHDRDHDDDHDDAGG